MTVVEVRRILVGVASKPDQKGVLNAFKAFQMSVRSARPHNTTIFNDRSDMGVKSTQQYLVLKFGAAGT